MFEHMQKLPIRYFDQNTNGSIMSLYTNDTDTLRQMINQSIPQVLHVPADGGCDLYLHAGIKPAFNCPCRCHDRSYAVCDKNHRRKQRKIFPQAAACHLADVTGFVEEHMNGQRVIKVFNHERIAEEEFDELNEKLYPQCCQCKYLCQYDGTGNWKHRKSAVCSDSRLGRFPLCHGNRRNYSGCHGILSAVYQELYTAVHVQVAQQFNSIVMALAGAERIFRMMDEEPEVDEGYVTLVNARKDADGTITECKERTGMWAWKHPHQADGTVTYTELKGDVRFFDMTFGYTDEKMVLHDLTLYAKPGQKLAFVGSTGAGKTTITNLINRFYDVQDGKIRYDGININKIKKADLRRSLGYCACRIPTCLQEPLWIISDMESWMRRMRKYYAAAQLAHADQFIQMLPKGYDTMLTSDGEELSQGQRQLLAIARAAVANPPVLILDEATSSIDTRTEQHCSERYG